MGLIAVPNVSEGRDPRRIAALAEAVRGGGGRIVDTHADEVHNRTVFTVEGVGEGLVGSLVALACASRSIDLSRHMGIHPRIGVLDVCPIVPHGSSMEAAIEVAELTGREIAHQCKLPVYLYGMAAKREEARELPGLRRGGLTKLIERASSGLAPDLGPQSIDPRFGVVCVGARRPLVAFNVWLNSTGEIAQGIARRIRTTEGGQPGVRALGLQLDGSTSQVSMNLTAPDVTGIDDIFAVVKALAEDAGATIVATEIVGVPPERYMPDPQKEAARLLTKPGRSLESALAG